MTEPPSIGPDGTIYVTSSDHLFAFYDNSTLKWDFKAESPIAGSVSIDADGLIYVGTANGYYILSDNSSVKFKSSNPDFNNFDNQLALGKSGSIYAMIHTNLRAFTDNETELWNYSFSSYACRAPTISNNSYLFVTNRYTLYAFETDSGGIMDSSWPKYKHDIKNTGRSFKLPSIETFSATPEEGNAPPEVNFKIAAKDTYGLTTYRLSFGDNTSSEGSMDNMTETMLSISHTYSNPDNYTAELTVKNKHTMIARRRIVINVQQTPAIPPIIHSFNVDPSSGNPPLKVVFSVYASDPDGSIVAHMWDVNNDGTYERVTPENSLTYTYDKSGTFIASVTVVDNDNLSRKSDTVTVTVSNPKIAPTIKSFMARPITGETPLQVVFSCSAEDKDGYIVSYTWSFGDGTQLTTKTNSAIHMYTTPGNYYVSVIVIDNDNLQKASNVLKINAYKKNIQPEIISLSTTPPVGYAPLSVSIQCSARDKDGTVTSYTFSTGDGDDPVSSHSNSLTHTYTTPGTYLISVTVKDNMGLSSNQVSKSVTVMTDNNSSDSNFIEKFYPWAKEAVDYLYASGIVIGYPDGSYKPAAETSRAQIATMLVRALDLKISPCAVPPFQDVSIDSWACPYIQAMKEAGVVRGYPDGRYGPEDGLSRVQIAILLTRSLKLKTTPCSTSPFPDVEKDAWYCPYVQAIKLAGITKGFPDGTYRPDDTVTRAQMAVYLERAKLYESGSNNSNFKF